jgi:hypothetical protein
LLTWGAADDEVAAALPGDDVVARPQYVATNAVTIGAPASAVWPWLVQMGAYTRAGWYAFDHLDNAGVPSSRRIVPELQQLRVGDVMPTARDGSGFVVEALDPNRSMVLTIRDPDALTSSVMVLQPGPAEQTRLIVRLRLRVRPTMRGALYRMVMELGHVPMTLKMLAGIRARVEARATWRSEPAGPRRRPETWS